MSMLSDIKKILSPLNISMETGVFTDKAPDSYIVVTPIEESYDVFADNKPLIDVHEVRISIYTKGNYSKLKNDIVNAFLKADITITNRQYIGYETDTGYHHYNIDVANYYEMEEL